MKTFINNWIEEVNSNITYATAQENDDEVALLNQQLVFVNKKKDEFEHVVNLSWHNREEIKNSVEKDNLIVFYYFKSKNDKCYDFYREKLKLLKKKLRYCELIDLYPNSRKMKKYQKELQVNKKILVKNEHYEAAANLRDEEAKVTHLLDNNY